MAGSSLEERSLQMSKMSTGWTLRQTTGASWKKISDIIYEHGITTLVEAIKCQPMWDTDNGTTLCVLCHGEIDKSILNMCRPNAVR